jgi:hypothetical protein
VCVSVDELVGIDALERAALEFARSAPGELIGSAVDAMVAELFTEVCGPSGFPIDDDTQIVASWACPGCASVRGFRRRGAQSRRRKVTSLVGVVSLRSAMVECRSCGRRFSPLGQLLGLAPRQRRTVEVSKATAALAVQVAYAKAARLLAEIGGVDGHTPVGRTSDKEEFMSTSKKRRPGRPSDRVPGRGGVSRVILGVFSLRVGAGRWQCRAVR